MNDLEREVVILNAAWALIDDMVNYELLGGIGDVNSAQIWFKTSTHARLFSILLGDFLSYADTKRGSPIEIVGLGKLRRDSPSDRTFLLYLKSVCSNPMLGDASGLAHSVNEFRSWLEQKAILEKAWFPSLDLEVDLSISRIEFMKICADTNKHNVLRLSGNVKRIKKIFEENGHSVKEENVFSVIAEFQEWFYEHVFSYHSSSIAEFLNNIRRQIYQYLLPEFSRAYQPDLKNEPMYSYRIPESIVSAMAIDMYWGLMNRVRAGLWFPDFAVTNILKQKF